tara:strand:+ start:528 stop:1358 length:831 start_codon:yes stop_codon:yes gene_type:complete
MLKKTLLFALLAGVSSFSLVQASAMDEDSKTPTGVTAGYDSDEDIAALERKVANLKAQKEEKRRAEKEAKKAALLKEAEALEAELSGASETEKSPESGDDSSLDKPSKPEGREFDLSTGKEVSSKGGTNDSGLPDKLFSFIDENFGGASNPRGNVVDSVKWALEHSGMAPESVKMNPAYPVFNEVTPALVFPYASHYRGADTTEVILFASEMTRSDELNPNMTHTQWKFQYNPSGNNTLHPTHCYYTPNGQKKPAPKSDLFTSRTAQSVLSAFGLK